MAQTYLQEKFEGRENQVLKFNSQGELEAVDIEIRSIKPQIVVTAETGSTVTCNRSGVVLSATEDSGKWVFNLPSIGNWECIAINSIGDIGKETVEVTELKQYNIEITIGEHIYTGDNFNLNSWELISSLASASLASSYWNVGDKKLITLNGTPNIEHWIEFENYEVYAVIIGFDHNSELEGIGLVHFQVGILYKHPTTGIVDGTSRIAFFDTQRGGTGENAYGSAFVMNTRSVASSPVAWSDCRMRTVYCPRFKNCLSDDLKSVLGTVNKYTDNSKSDSSSTYNYTSTKDTIFLLSKYEINCGSTYREQDWQKIYPYYENNIGFNRRYVLTSVKSSTSAVSPTVTFNSSYYYWWLRTPGKSKSGSGSNYYTFYASSTSSDSATRYSAEYSLGFSPAFVVGKKN